MPFQYLMPITYMITDIDDVPVIMRRIILLYV